MPPKVKRPLLPVVPVKVVFVGVCTAVMAAPATGLPSASMTVPVIPAETTWARPGKMARPSARALANRNFSRDFLGMEVVVRFFAVRKSV